MAEFGAKHPCFKGNDAESGVVIGKLVSANLTVNLASGEIYADDSLAEQLSEFSSGSIAMETDDLTDSNASQIYGCKVADGAVIYNTGDTAPMGSLAYYKVLMRNGVKMYKGFYYPRVRAALGNDNAATKGSSITFQTTSTAFTVFAGDDGNWRETKMFTDEAGAKGWVESKTAVGTYYEVSVSVQGSGSVDKVGTFYVSDGADFVLGITGTPAALYDNGTDAKASISGNKYTISGVSAAHTIAVIF